MDKKQSKVKGFLSTYKKSIITCVFSFIAMSLIFAVAISSNRTTSNIDNGGSNLEINKEEDIIKDPSVPTNNPTTISFILPLENYELTKDFSNTNLKYNATLKQWEAHKAVDLKASEGERVLVVFDGKVESVKNDYLKGTTITVAHADGFKTVYASLLENVLVNVGDSVSQGGVLGYVSTSAKGELSDGAHLHFEMVKDGVAVDPNLYLTFEGK